MTAQQTELVPASAPESRVVRPDTGAGTVADILRGAVEHNADIGTIERMMALYERDQATQAAAAFNAAVVQFQQECPIIPKLDKAYDKYYARMDRIWRTIRPLMERCGLAVTWESMKTVEGVCILDGHLRHARGHVQTLHHEVPLPELIKGQNSAQRAASGETYAKRYATCAALGIQTGDDDDGAGGRGPQDAATITSEQAAEIAALLKGQPGREAKMLQNYDIGSVAELPASRYAEVVRILKGA